MADNYKYLTDGEKAYWDIYCRLRELSDWAGFTAGQETTKQTAREWLQERRKEIWRSAQPKADGGDGKGWGVSNRDERYEQLKDESLNTGSCRRVTQLPTNGNTAGEKAQLSEREMWWQVSSVDDQTKAWRQANADYCTATRKKIYSLAQSEGWDFADRKIRWNNFCVATKTGVPYKEWEKSHDETTGEPNPPTTTEPVSSRAKAVSNARKYLGVNEKPAGSNKGSPQPSTWQKRVIGSDGYAWCACFTTCMAWDAGVKGASSAGVIVCMTMAQRGQGMFRGWTTDPSKVLRGDFAVVGCSSCHIGLVADSNNPYHLIEGNTSPGKEGSQFNGGCVAEKTRPKGQIIGWCLVNYPD